MADKLNGVFISELLADNAGGAAIDTDGDGAINKSDEFIELQNTAGADISLDGYEVWSEKNGLLYSFGVGDIIAAGGTATIVGNYSGTPPAGFFDAGIAEGSNFIPDGESAQFDSIFLVDTATGEYIVLSYGVPPQAPTLPTGFPGTTQIGSGESISSGAPNGTAFARDANGNLVETTPTPGTPDIACFASGTRIKTDQGDLLIENLQPGALVLTKDNGYVPLRAVRSTSLSRGTIVRNPSLKPVVFPTDSIGNSRPLSLSGSHRILIENEWTALLFGSEGVLLPANCAEGVNEVRRDSIDQSVIYFHLLFDRHEIIQAENCWVESLYLGDVAHQTSDALTQWHCETSVVVSELSHKCAARPILRGYEAVVLLKMEAPKKQRVLEIAA